MQRKTAMKMSGWCNCQSLRSLAVLFVLFFFSITTVHAQSELLFDLRASDLNKEAFSLEGIVEFYENQIVDPHLLFEAGDNGKQVIHFPGGLQRWAEQSASESDLYGTLKMSVLTSPNLANTYQSLMVDLPAREVKIWINGHRLYSEATYDEGNLLDQKTSSSQSVIFQAAAGKQEILIQFKQLERRHPGTMAIILGNPSAVNSFVNSRFVMDMLYILVVAVIMTFVFVMVTLGRRRDSRRFRKFLHLVILASGISLLRFMAIDGNGLLSHLLGNYMETYLRLKYAGLMLALPLMVVYMSRISGIKLESKLVKLAAPYFWFMLIVVVLGGNAQFELIAKCYLILELSCCVYLLFKVAQIAFEKGQRAYRAMLISTVLIYGLLAIRLFTGAITGWTDDFMQYGLMSALFVLQIGLAVRVTREANLKVVSKINVLPPLEPCDDEPKMPQDEGHSEGTLKGQDMAQLGMLLWAVNRQGQVIQTWGDWSFMDELGPLVGQNVAVVLGFDATNRAHFEYALDQPEANACKGLLDQLPSKTVWSESVLSQSFFVMDHDPEWRQLFIKFEDITEQEASKQKTLEDYQQVGRCKRVFLDYVILRRWADDFIKYMRVDAVAILETYEGQNGLRRVLSDLEMFRHLFGYYEMAHSTMYLTSLIDKLIKGHSDGKSHGLKSFDETAIEKDLLDLEQACDGFLNSEAGIQLLSIRELDLLEEAFSYELEGSGKVEATRQRKLTLLKRSLEGYTKYLANVFNYPLALVEIELSNVHLSESLFWDLQKSAIRLINNAVEHGFESDHERHKSNKTSGNRLYIKLHLVKEDHKEILQLQVVDDGRGIPVDDIRSRLYADRKMNFDEAKNLPEQVAVHQIFNPGFAMPVKRQLVERGYGLHFVNALARQYGGEAQAICKGQKGTTFILSLPYIGKSDYGVQKYESFIKALEHSILKVSDSVGLRHEQERLFEFYPTKDGKAHLEAYTTCQSIYWRQELQVIFTANKPLLETVGHVYGVDFDTFKIEETKDLLNEIVNVAIGGAIRTLPEMANAVHVGKPIHFEGVSEVQLQADQIYVANFNRGAMIFTAYITVG